MLRDVLRIAQTTVIGMLCFFLICEGITAQDETGDTGQAGAAPKDLSPAGVFAAKLTEWKDVLKELRKLQADYANAEPSEVAGIESRWGELIAKGEAMIPELREAGKQAYLAAPNEDDELTEFLVTIVKDDVKGDDYEAAVELSQVLLENGCEEKELYEPAGLAAFATNDFDKADEYLDKAKDENSLSDEVKNKYADEIDDYKEFWKEEQKLREKEAEANDLPRVRLTTSKGDLVIELFENEAPDTVGNFISLVEQGFYDGLSFHRVLAGFMAQGGCPRGDGTGGPGYNIYCECYKDGARKHFRGTLSMAHAGRNTGGSQFFLTFLPTPHLNGKHTVFGRVIEGMEVLAKLQRIDPQASGSKPDPDKIIEAKVIRKREHEYKPNKVN
jgi:cyclophilin family peptidyl-prolyl cis-trans isomerase